MVSYRIRPIVLSVILATITLLICTKLAGFGFGWIKNLATPGTVRSWVAPATGLGMAITGLCHLIGFDVSMGPILSVTRLMGLMGAMSAAVYLLWRAQSRGWVRSLGMSLLLFVVLGPVVQPWYLVWGLVVLAASYQGREHFWLLALSITSPFLGLPGAQDLWRSLLHANPLLMAVALVILLGTLLVPLGRWTQWSWPEVDDRRAREVSGMTYWNSTTSSHFPCLRPTSISRPTRENPTFSWSLIDDSLAPTIRAIIE